MSIKSVKANPSLATLINRNRHLMPVPVEGNDIITELLARLQKVDVWANKWADRSGLPRGDNSLHRIIDGKEPRQD
jgi:hypothetical protein